MALFVVVDVGCIECGEDSHVLGVFTARERAEAVRAEAEGRAGNEGHGINHCFELFEVPGLDRVGRVLADGHWSTSGRMVWE